MKRSTVRGLSARAAVCGRVSLPTGGAPSGTKFAGATGRGLAAFALAFLCAFAAPPGTRAQQVARLAGSGANAKGAPAPEARPASPPRRIASVRAASTPAGSRVVITSDTPLDDYTAYRAGSRFHVLIPRADASNVSQNLSAAGFADARVERRGADVLLSFALAPNVAARVRQNFNRLEVILDRKSVV